MSNIMHHYLKQSHFARERFGNLKDGSGTLIFDHGYRVAIFLNYFLKPYHLDSELHESLVLAGLFHDLLEDTKTTEKEILSLSNKDTLRYVKEMTISFENCSIKKAVKPLYKTSDELTIIKLADIYDNTKKSNFVTRINGLTWYNNFYSPLLSEYRKLMDYKVKKAKKYKKIIKGLRSFVFSEVDLFEEILKQFKEIL